MDESNTQSTESSTMPNHTIATPEPFDFHKAESLPIWFRRLQKFRVASGLHKRKEEEQINSLIYHMGDTADDILLSFRLSDEESR